MGMTIRLSLNSCSFISSSHLVWSYQAQWMLFSTCPQWSVGADKRGDQRQPRACWEHPANAQLPERTDHSAPV